MIALDTNILVRLLVQDDVEQAKKVGELLHAAEINKQIYFVTLLVVLELIWVLEAVYDASKEDILHSLTELLSMPVLSFEKQNALRSFIVSARGTSFDLSDMLIAHSAKDEGCKMTYTFDKKAAKFKLFQKL